MLAIEVLPCSTCSGVYMQRVQGSGLCACFRHPIRYEPFLVAETDMDAAAPASSSTSNGDSRSSSGSPSPAGKGDGAFNTLAKYGHGREDVTLCVLLSLGACKA